LNSPRLTSGALCRSRRSLTSATGLFALLPLRPAAGWRAPRPKPQPPSAKLLSASLQQLVSTFNKNAEAIQSMTLKLELTAKVGDKKYPRINAFLLTQKPSSIRLWGTFTLVGRLFDMASDGTHFELSLPTRNQLIEGQNNVIPAVTANPLEKLRPQVRLNALLSNPIAPDLHVALDPSETAAEYDVLVLQSGPGQVDHLLRRITFSRYDLMPHSQVIYDGDGVHSTRASYSNFTERQGIPIPTDITIERPVEGYTLRLQVASDGIAINKPSTAPHPFQLDTPPGSTVIKLSSAPPPPGVVAGVLN